MTTYICSMALIALVNGVECPPPIHETSLLILNYWPLNELNEFVPFNYQADDSPQYAGTGFKLEVDMAGQVGACISGWSKSGWTTAVSFWYREEYHTVVCVDSFGLNSYRHPFYHPNFEQYVIALDIFSPTPIYELIEEWTITTVNTQEMFAR